MLHLLKNGNWFRVYHGDYKGLMEENPMIEHLGESSGGKEAKDKLCRRIYRSSSDVRGQWYLIKDEGFIKELENRFVSSSVGSTEGIHSRYFAQAGESSVAVLGMYDQMHGWLSVHRELLRDSVMWRSRLLGFCEILRTLGSQVFRWYHGVMRWHSGRIWDECKDVEFRISLQYFCLDDLGIGAMEWTRYEKRFISSVEEGSKMSPLGVSHSIVGFQNGVYDFSTGHAVFHPFEERLPVISLLPYSYDAKSKCPLWLSFLGGALSRSQVDLLQRYFGLELADRFVMPYKVENSLWLVGPGGVGKSTIMNVIRYVVGEDNVSSVSLGSLINGNSENRARFMAAINGKVFNYCGEIQVEDMTRGSDSFKSLCSGEPQPMRRIGFNVELANDIPYMIFNMNRRPKNSAIDGALRRRLLFVTFTSVVRECDRDPNLEEKLKREASGIRNWMLEGYRKFVTSGGILSPTMESNDTTDEWLVENGQTVDAFLGRRGYRAYPYMGIDEKGEWVSVKSLYDGYAEWCHQRGLDCDCELAGMGRELRKIGFKPRRTGKGIEYRIFRDKKK